MKPRIAVINRHVRYHDGAGTINLEVAREALRRGYEVTIVATILDSGMMAQPNVTFVPIPIGRVPTALLQMLLFGLFTSLWLLRNRKRFDVVIANGMSTFSRVDLNIVQFVFAEWVHSPDVRTPKLTSLRSVYHYLFARAMVPFENAALRRSRRLIACSETIRDDLKRRVGIPSHRIVVILNGTRTELFRRSDSQRDRFSLPPDVPIVLFAGEITTKRKNLDVIFDALELVPELHLAVASHYQPGNEYVEMARTRGLDQRIHFVGKCDDMPALMSSVDFFAHFAHYEPFGLVIIEALACGLPTVTAANVGAACAVTPECGIVLTAPASSADVARAFRSLLDDTDRTRQLSEGARIAGARFSLERMTAAYSSEIDDIVKPG